MNHTSSIPLPDKKVSELTPRRLSGRARPELSGRADGSMKESPLYAHKPIGEDLWRIPEMLRGRIDLYNEGLYRVALNAFAELATPLGTQPVLDDTYDTTRVPKRTVDIARERCGINIPDPGGAPSDFAVLNSDLKRAQKCSRHTALNKYYTGRHLACIGFGTGTKRVQLYMSGADALTHGHRHADAFNVQLYAGPWEVFPDVGYIWDHPGKKWAAATASHQTVVVDGKNSVPAAASRLLGFCGEGRSRFVDMAVELEGGIALRRALTLLRLDDGMPLLIDLFEVEGGRQHDYQMRAQLPSDPIRVAAAQRLLPETFEAQVSMQHYEKPARPPQLQISGIELTPRKKALYQEHSYYPLRDLRSGGQLHGGWTAVWRKGRRQVRAHVLTPCSELVAYRSALAIADGPDNYHDTAVLRSRKKRSRFAVVYEVVEGRRQVRAVEYREVATGIEVVVRLMAGRQIEIAVPAVMTAASEKNWHVRWRSK